MTKRKIFYAALIIFIFRAAPSVGSGYTWFTMDVLGFDEAFQGTLNQIGTALALIGTWLFSDAITRRPVTQVLLWLTVATAMLSLPSLGLTMGLHTWTESMFGFGARTIAIVDTAASSPFVQLSMIPLLTLCAIYAPEGPARQLVRADGVADELGAGRGSVADQISQYGAGRRTRVLRQLARSADGRDGDRARRAAGGDLGVRQKNQCHSTGHWWRANHRQANYWLGRPRLLLVAVVLVFFGRAADLARD